MKLGKLYIGESAGAIIASPDAEYMRSVNFDPIEKAPELKDCTSLDLVDFYTIPHYGNFPFKKKGEKIVQLYNEKLQLIPISNKQAVIIEDSNIQIKSYIAKLWIKKIKTKQFLLLYQLRLHENPT